MVFVEVTREVAKHKVAEGYLCVRVHFLAEDDHFHLTRIELPDGKISVANYMPKDEEVAEIVALRLQARDPVNLLILLDKILHRHGYEIRGR